MPAHPVAGGATIFEIATGMLIAPVMAVFIQQQLRDHAGKNISYFEALGMVAGSQFSRR